MLSSLPDKILDEAVDGEERRIVEADVRADARQCRGGLRGAAARHSHVRRGRHGRGRDPKAAPPYLRAARGRASKRAWTFRGTRATTTSCATVLYLLDTEQRSSDNDEELLRGRTIYCYIVNYWVFSNKSNRCITSCEHYWDSKIYNILFVWYVKILKFLSNKCARWN